MENRHACITCCALLIAALVLLVAAPAGAHEARRDFFSGGAWLRGTLPNGHVVHVWGRLPSTNAATHGTAFAVIVRDGWQTVCEDYWSPHSTLTSRFVTDATTFGMLRGTGPCGVVIADWQATGPPSVTPEDPAPSLLGGCIPSGIHAFVSVQTTSPANAVATLDGEPISVEDALLGHSLAPFHEVNAPVYGYC